MSLALTSQQQAFVDASNGFNSPALLDCFDLDAMVRDDGHTYTGIEEVRMWFAHLTQEYHPSIRPTSVDATDNTALLTAEVSGTFDGSPIISKYRFTYADNGKIATLVIGD